MPALDPRVIGQRIEYLRKAKGLSQRDLAKKSGVAQSAISDFEAGKRLPSTAAFTKLLAFFDISASDLISVEEVDLTQSKRQFFIKLILDRLNAMPIEELEFVVQFIDRISALRRTNPHPFLPESRL